MAAGMVTIQILDGIGQLRDFNVWSSDGTVNGDLGFLPPGVYLNADGSLQPISDANGQPVRIKAGQASLTGSLPSGGNIIGGIFSTDPTSYYNRANWVTGYTLTNGNSVVGCISAPAAGLSVFVTRLQAFNSNITTDVNIALNDLGPGGPTTLHIPRNSEIVVSFDPPLVTPVATGLTFQASASVASVAVSAQGYKATF